MKEFVGNGLLYDFYGELLTPHQRKVYEAAVYEDMSLNEIAEQHGISRQGVHDLLKRCTKTMQEYEDRLHMVDRFMRVREETARLRLFVKESGTKGYSDRQLLGVAKRIEEVLEQ